MTIQLNWKTPTKIVRWHNWAEQAVKKIVIYPDGVTEKQIRPAWWQPWANTILYCPLKDDINDATWNHTMTSGWVSKWTIWYIFGSGSYIKTSDSFAWPQYATICLWQKRSSANDNSLLASKCTNWTAPYHYFWIKYRDSWGWNKTLDLEISISWWDSNPVVTSWWTDISLKTRHNIVWIFDGSGMKIYVDGVVYDTKSVSWTLLTTSSIFAIWNFTNFNQYFNWELSEVIFEDKARTVDEIKAYYNQTCQDYWLQPIS